MKLSNKERLILRCSFIGSSCGQIRRWHRFRLHPALGTLIHQRLAKTPQPSPRASTTELVQVQQVAPPSWRRKASAQSWPKQKSNRFNPSSKSWRFSKGKSVSKWSKTAKYSKGVALFRKSSARLSALITFSSQAKCSVMWWQFTIRTRLRSAKSGSIGSSQWGNSSRRLPLIWNYRGQKTLLCASATLILHLTQVRAKSS